MNVLVRYRLGGWYVSPSVPGEIDTRHEKKGTAMAAARERISGKGGHIVVMTKVGELDAVIDVPRHRALTGDKRK